MADLKEGNITWAQASAIADEYKQVLDREFQGHQLYVDKHGTIRWVADPERENEIMAEFGARDMNDLYLKGGDKNDPRMRELYKHIGYSLSGFWEVFYW